jgi:transcriptional regulator with XRE-family HTH domain
MKRIRLAARRKTVGLSQEALAEKLEVDVSTVRRWEYGEREPQPWHRPRLAATLMVSLDELDLLLTANDPQPSHTLGPFPFHQTQSAEPGDDLSVMQSLRLADRQAGGGQLYATITGYLQHTVAPRLFGTHPLGHDEQLFAAAAGLTEMAGWMAHDANRDEAAQRHFHGALGLATTADDPQLESHILASLSHLSYARKQPAQAVLHARRGRQRLELRQTACVVRARLSAMEARGHAIMGDEQQCTEHLRQAESVLQAGPDDDRSSWVSDFDAASLAAEAARCFHDLGRLDAARRRAQEVVTLRPADRPRSRAYAQLLLASVLIAQRKIDEAAAIGGAVLDTTRNVSSFPVLQQLSELGAVLSEHRTNRDVAAFLELLQQELATRKRKRGIASS